MFHLPGKWSFSCFFAAVLLWGIFKVCFCMDLNEPFAKEETRVICFVVSHTLGPWLWNEQHLVSGHQYLFYWCSLHFQVYNSSILCFGALQTHKHSKTHIAVLLHLQTEQTSEPDLLVVFTTIFNFSWMPYMLCTSHE